MPFELKSLSSSKRVPIPFRYSEDRVEIGGDGESHYVRMFPAIIREKDTSVSMPTQLNEDGATCFFHESIPATAICEVSGRMICDLCKTEWEGRIVSFQALQALVKGDGASKKNRGAFRWDRLAYGLVIFPILFAPVTLITAPILLAICGMQIVRPSQASPVPAKRWHFVIPLLVALCEVIFWVYFFLFSIS